MPHLANYLQNNVKYEEGKRGKVILEAFYKLIVFPFLVSSFSRQAVAIQCADTDFPSPLSSLQAGFRHAGLWVNGLRDGKTCSSPFVRWSVSDFAKPLISTQRVIQENKSLCGLFPLISAIKETQTVMEFVC